MTDFEKIRTAFARQTKALELRPGIGRGTAVTRARVRDGLTVDVEEGEWKLVVDMNEKWGGNGAGPNPGILGRGALGSCLAIAYMQWAARLGIRVDNLEVEVHADYDTRGSCGIGDLPPSYGAVRYVVSVETDASESDVEHWLQTAEDNCPYLHVFARELPPQRELRLTIRGE